MRADGILPEIVIITGMSGAGRSTAAKSLEDLDWFVRTLTGGWTIATPALHEVQQRLCPSIDSATPGGVACRLPDDRRQRCLEGGPVLISLQARRRPYSRPEASFSRRRATREV